jgi:hypothetical protein
MCHVSDEKRESQIDTLCRSGCCCPVILPAGEGLRSLEDHRKILQRGPGMIDEKFTALKSVKKP